MVSSCMFLRWCVFNWLFFTCAATVVMLATDMIIGNNFFTVTFFSSNGPFFDCRIVKVLGR